MAGLSGLSLEKIKDLPGSDDKYQIATANHELEHCDDDHHTTPHSSVESARREEIRADIASVVNLQDRDDHKITDIIVSARKIGGRFDPKHDTGYALENNDLSLNTTDREKIDTWRAAIDDVIAPQIGDLANEAGHYPHYVFENNTETAAEMYEDYTEIYMYATKDALQNGQFDHDPALKNFAQDLVSSYEKIAVIPDKIEKQPPANFDDIDMAAFIEQQRENEKKAPSSPEGPANNIPAQKGVTLERGDTKDSLKIDGQSPSAYFQDRAHPELAAQKIALENEQKIAAQQALEQGAVNNADYKAAQGLAV